MSSNNVECNQMRETYFYTYNEYSILSRAMFHYLAKNDPHIPITLAKQCSYIKDYYGKPYQVINYFVDSDLDLWYLCKNGKKLQTVKFGNPPQVYNLVVFQKRLWRRLGKYQIEDCETGKIWKYLNFNMLAKKLRLCKLIS